VVNHESRHRRRNDPRVRRIASRMSFRDHFSGVAEGYARYRPHYPRALVELLAEGCPRHELAWEAGCGNGQLSVALGDRFARVIATDPARAQLEHAEPHPHVEYRCAPAEHGGLPDACADLAVAAQAAHWFDWPAYVAEVERVARPGALCAILAYGNCWIARPGSAGARSNAERGGSIDGAADPIVRSYYDDLGPYWPPERRHIENGYRELAWPWPAVAAPDIDMVAHWTRAELVGYLATWSATQKHIAALGGARFDDVCAELARVWPDGERRAVRWPLAIRLARR
jgi:SAM-dependent methyltransferase